MKQDPDHRWQNALETAEKEMFLFVPASTLRRHVRITLPTARKRLVCTIEYIEQCLLHLSRQPSRLKTVHILSAAIGSFKAIDARCPDWEIHRFVSRCINLCYELEEFYQLPRKEQRQIRAQHERS